MAPLVRAKASLGGLVLGALGASLARRGCGVLLWSEMPALQKPGRIQCVELTKGFK